MGIDKNLEEIAITQFRDLFIETYQNMQLLQGTTEEEHGIIGDAYKWPIIGKVEHKKRTSFLSQPAPSEINFDEITTVFEEYALNVPLDKRQQKLLRANVQAAYVKAHTKSLGRRIDQFKLDALANATSEVPVGTTNMTVAKLLEVIEILGDENTPVSDRFFMMGWSQMASLLNDAKATNSDYVGTLYDIKTGKIDSLLGMKFIVVGKGDVGVLPKITNNRTCYAWQKEAIGTVYQMEPDFWVTEDETKFNWLTLSRASLGADLLQKNTAGNFEGVVKVIADETK